MPFNFCQSHGRVSGVHHFEVESETDEEEEGYNDDSMPDCCTRGSGPGDAVAAAAL